MYDNDQKKLLDVTNDKYPEAGGKAYSENEYYNEPLERLKAIGEPGLDYSLEGQHAETWSFGITGSNLEPGLDQWFNADGFILQSKVALLSDPANVLILEDLLQAIYETTPDEIKYSLTVAKDANDNFIQTIKDKFGRVVRTSADADPVDNTKGEIVSESIYDILGNTLESIPPKNRDAGGTPVQLMESTYNLYNTYGKVIQKTTPDNGTTYYGYDDAGNLVGYQKGSETGQYISMAYDELNRVVNIKADFIDQIKKYYDNTENFSDIEQYIPTSGDISLFHNISTELENLKGNLAAEVSIGYDPAGSATVPDKNRCIIDLYSYDEDGRIKSSYKYIPGISWQKVSYSYDLQDKIVKKEEFPQYLSAQAPAPVIFKYHYDNLGKLMYLTKDDENKKIFANAYDEIGRLISKEYYATNGTAVAKKIDYSYTIRDWLSGIDGGSQFSEEIGYTRDFTGKVTNATYTYNTGVINNSYDLDYTYDGTDRLTSVENTGDPASQYNEALSFDQVGRITQKRKGASTLDGFNQFYTYNNLTNKLNYITNKQNADNYAYDDYGNMVSDKSKKMDEVLYDWRDMPVRFNLKENGEKWNSSVDIVYDAAGNRVIKKETVLSHDTITRAKAVAYVGSDMVFENENYQAEAYALKYINIDGEGRLDYPSLSPYYYIKDHLGSTRTVVDGNGEVIEASMYDAYGKLEQLVYSGTSSRLREKFTGKELDDDGAVAGETNGLGLYYFGVRYYDPEIGTFTTTDPKDVYHNSYSYCGGDPVNLIDPRGDDPLAFVMLALSLALWYMQNALDRENPNPLDWDWGDPELIYSTASLAVSAVATVAMEVQAAKAAAGAAKAEEAVEVSETTPKGKVGTPEAEVGQQLDPSQTPGQAKLKEVFGKNAEVQNVVYDKNTQSLKYDVLLKNGDKIKYDNLPQAEYFVDKNGTTFSVIEKSGTITGTPKGTLRLGLTEKLSGNVISVKGEYATLPGKVSVVMEHPNFLCRSRTPTLTLNARWEVTFGTPFSNPTLGQLLNPFRCKSCY